MNRVYKVIWSKAKHCYVVTSEIAKGHTKGETTGKGLKKLAAAMLVAAALLSPSFAWAEGETVMVNNTSGTAVEVYTKDGTDTQVNAARTYTYRKVAAEAAAREAKDNELNERITAEAQAIHETTNKMQEDTVVQDGAVVKAANTIGDNVTKLDAALKTETADRKAEDTRLNSEIVKTNNSLNEAATNLSKLNTAVVEGFKTLKQADANEAKARDAAEKTLQTNIDNEAAERKAADAALVHATNGRLSLGDGNVLQTNTTSIDDATGEVTTSKTDVNEMILKGKDNQITLNEKGIKVGTNSSVVDKDGVYTGGDNYIAAQAAMRADGSIKGAGGDFTVDGTNGNVNTKGSVSAASGTIGNVSMSADGTVTGVKDLTASGKVTADSFTDGTATMSNGSLNGVNQINATGNIVTTGNMQAHDMTATGTITGQEINGTTGTFGSLSTTGNASVGGTLTTNGITNNGNATTDTLTVKHNATVGGDLGVTGDITGKSLNVGTGDIKGGQITGTGLDVGAGTIKTTGAVETGTLKTTGDATIGGNLSVDKNLTVNGEFNSKTLSSKLDENNYTTINGGKTESKNLKMDAGEMQASASTFDETGSQAWARDDDSIGKSSMTADKISQSLSDIGDNPKNMASRELSQNTNNKYEITDSVVEGNQSNVENRTADTTDSQISLKDDSGKVLNKSYITQNLKKVLMGVEEGDNKTTIEQDANNITNTAKNGTITNDADKVLNQATTSVISQIGDGTAVKSEMSAKGITNTAKDGTITNDAKDVFNKGTNSVINEVGDNQVAVKTDSVKAAYGSDASTTWNADGITNTASKSIISQIGDGSAVKSEMTADGITNTAEGGTISNKSKDILNEASGDIINWANGEIGNVAAKITNITGDNTVTSDTNGTTFENTDKKDKVTFMGKEKSVDTKETTISGNTITTGEAVMDYADVMKDLGVRGNATIKGDTTMEGNASVGKDLTVAGTSTLTGDVTMKSNATVEKDLTVNGKSTLTGDVTMKSNATVEKDLTVKGTTTTDKLVVSNGAAVTGGTTTDKLHVTSTSQFDGAATFKDIVTMEKDLNVGGNVDAASYKVDGKTYIDKDGINANNKVIRNVGQGDISEGSTDAVSGGQLYETNTRVSGLETRMGTVETKVDKLDNKIDKVGANAAAMANLHPLEFDEDSKWNIAAAVGSSGSETASAVGVFYRPNENVMVNASAAMGTGENMFGGGVSLRLGHGGNKAKEAQMKAAAKENRELRAKVDDLTARMDALLSVLNPNMSKDFPDVPENHWAYEAVSRLAGNGIVEGYEDGKYHGERQMTRYEMAEIIYNALSKGAKAEKKLVEEFRPELQAMAAQTKA